MELEYDDSFDPPAPVLKASVGSLRPPHIKDDVVALIDTGADITAVPRAALQKIRPNLSGFTVIVDARGRKEVEPTFAVTMEFLDFKTNVEVIGTDDKVTLLGRDLLNTYLVVLNGKGTPKTFEIT